VHSQVHQRVIESLSPLSLQTKDITSEVTLFEHNRHHKEVGLSSMVRELLSDRFNVLVYIAAALARAAADRNFAVDDSRRVS